MLHSSEFWVREEESEFGALDPIKQFEDLYIVNCAYYQHEELGHLPTRSDLT